MSTLTKFLLIYFPLLTGNEGGGGQTYRGGGCGDGGSQGGRDGGVREDLGVEPCSITSVVHPFFHGLLN